MIWEWIISAIAIFLIFKLLEYLWRKGEKTIKDSPIKPKKELRLESGRVYKGGELGNEIIVVDKSKANPLVDKDIQIMDNPEMGRNVIVNNYRF